MTALSDSQDESDEFSGLNEWRQGDYVDDIDGFTFFEPPEGGSDLPYTAIEMSHVNDRQVIGLVLISQTCDIVINPNNDPDRSYVTASPLVKLDPSALGDMQRGASAKFARIEHHTEELVAADLGCTMCISKRLLLGWTRHRGFNEEQSRIRFGKAVERKFGRFAFPDDFAKAFQKFHKHVRSKHSNPNSPLANIYRSIREIRVRAAPRWDAPHKTLAVFIVLQDQSRMLVSAEQVRTEIHEQLSKVVLPEGYEKNKPFEFVDDARGFEAQMIYESQPLDFEILSY
ncbi:hypothetical protein [Pelagibius sp.]|uniref:hypothetical protein n=1 Tax=Pelagibius sp. TaxID=1931238 RepID=UPI003BB0FA1A